MIKALRDFHSLKAKGTNVLDIVPQLRAVEHTYDTKVLDALEAIYAPTTSSTKQDTSNKNPVTELLTATVMTLDQIK